jgi:hypothetical protein
MRRSTGGRQRATSRVVDGFTESAWKSLAIKSLRIGWAEGLRQAEQRLTRSTLQMLLLASVFEDVFPPASELPEVVAEVKARDWEALCARETHHGRGYTAAFCELEPRAVAAARDPSRLYSQARRLGLYLPARSWNCFWTWLELSPADEGARREVDASTWRGMPSAILDSHTQEGRRRGVKMTVASGHYEAHLHLAELVHAQGWPRVRREVHAMIERGAPQHRQLELGERKETRPVEHKPTIRFVDALVARKKAKGAPSPQSSRRTGPR